MKLLRETIRNIMLENQQHYERIVNMILTGNLDNINQALELAQALGYVTDLQYRTGYSPGTSTRHIWEMGVDPDLEAEIKNQYSIDFKSPLQIFYGRTAPTPGAIKIQLQTKEP